MSTKKESVYIFGWPSNLGGADTKLVHLLMLLANTYEITLVPNDKILLRNSVWLSFLKEHNVKFALFEHLPQRLSGFGVGFCNRQFFKEKIAHRAKAKGLKIVWSGEMMWHHEGELEAAKEGLIDKVLFLSEFQRRHLGPAHGDLPWIIVDNYVDRDSFPFKERKNPVFTIGRLSRPDPLKYPEDFPVFYEALRVPNTQFRVMAWSEDLSHKYRWHKFDNRWALLLPGEETQLEFLHSLDLFVYPLGHRFKESWGRSTAEAMLTGAIPLVPSGHHLENLMIHGESGFVCSDFEEYKETATQLFFDIRFRKRIAKQCREQAVTRFCCKERHLEIWNRVFS